MAEEKLDRPQVQPFGQPSASGFVSQIMPMQIDLGELVSVHASTRPSPCWLDSVRQQQE